MTKPTVFTSADTASSSRLRPWLELIRLPNLFTVPGDALAGFCLGSFVSALNPSLLSIRPFAISFAGLLFYCAGLLHNDYVDRDRDLQERPSRPIPSGRAAPRQVLFIGHVLNLGGMIVAFGIGLFPGIIACLLAVAAALYNFASKGTPLIGTLNIGLCRGLLFLLGASVISPNIVFSAPVLLSLISHILFISFVSEIAARETESYRSGPLRWVPSILLTVWFVGMRVLILPAGSYELVFMLISGAAAAWTFNSGARLKPGLSPAGIQQCIGLFLRGLLLTQAAVVAFAGGSFLLILLLLASLPLSGALGRRFYSS